MDAALGSVRDGCFWLEDVADAASYPRHTGTTPTSSWRRRLLRDVDRRAREAAQPRRQGGAARGRAVGWAASGRNGGFCEASLTHGEENGAPAGPRSTTCSSGWAENSTRSSRRHRLGLDCEFERTGELDVAVEPHQVECAPRGRRHLPRPDAVRAAGEQPDLPRRPAARRRRPVHPAKLAKELARPPPSSVSRSSSTPRSKPRMPSVGTPRSPCERRPARCVPQRVALATNVFRSLLPALPAPHGARVRLRADDRAAERRAAPLDRLVGQAGPR